MRPILMLEGVRDLHDARYCAAIGIGLLGFQLEGEHALKPAAIKEIVDWLSGPEAVGDFGFSPASAITEIAAAASLSWVRVSAGYALEEAAALPMPLIFNANETTEADRLVMLAKRFPSAMLELSATNAAQMEALTVSGLMSRCLLRCAEPDNVWKNLEQKGSQPFGFVLGAFTEDAGGLLDYDVCDDFVEQYADLVPA